jgi:signal peptidase I
MVKVPDVTASPSRRVGRTVYWVAFAVAVGCLVASVIWGRQVGHAYSEPSTSMENTIRPGNRLLVARGTDVRRGDVVVLSLPSRGGLFVRRVIGLPGDRVTCCDAAGRVDVDGKPIQETYLYPGDPPSTTAFSVTLGPGQLWVLGDHRSVAIDSRMWGPVPDADVVGRVAMVQAGSFHLVRTPATFVADGLAPPDGRTPGFVWPLGLGTLATLVLLVLIVLGIIRTLIRRIRRPRSRGGAA